jgi:hypothetical protein
MLCLPRHLDALGKINLDGEHISNVRRRQAARARWGVGGVRGA